MSKELHPHWRRTDALKEPLINPTDGYHASGGRGRTSGGEAKPQEACGRRGLASGGEVRPRAGKLHPLTTSLMASIGIILTVSLFASGLRNLTAQLVEEGAATLRVTTQGLSPMELSLSDRDVLVIEWLHPNPGVVQSKETNEGSEPFLKTAELQMDDKERITVAAEWKVAELTLEASVHPGVTATVLLAGGKEQEGGTASPQVAAPVPQIALSPTSPASPVSPPGPIPVSPSSDSSVSSDSSDSSPPLPPPVPTPAPTPPLEATLEAPILPKVTTIPTLRVNRYTVGSPLVPEGALPAVSLGEFAGVHGAAPLHGFTYPELVLTPPTTVPGQEFIPPPPSPRVRRQPETGPFLGGLVAVCAVASLVIVGRKRVKKGKRRK